MIHMWFSTCGFFVRVVFYNKLPWFVSELPEKEILKWWSSICNFINFVSERDGLG